MSNKSMIDDILGQIIALTDEEDGDHSPADVEGDTDHVDPEGQEPEHEMKMQPEEASIEIASPDGEGDEDLLDALDDLDWDDDESSDLGHEEKEDALEGDIQHDLNELEYLNDKKEDPLKLAKGGEVRRKPFGTMRRC